MCALFPWENNTNVMLKDFSQCNQGVQLPAVIYLGGDTQVDCFTGNEFPEINERQGHLSAAYWYQ